MQLLWHKIGIYGKVDEVSEGRVGYSHILCFSRRNHGDIYDKLPDVISAHTKIYSNSTAIEITSLIFDFLRTYMKRKQDDKLLDYDIVEPFVGQGTAALFAEKYGFKFLVSST